MPRSLPLPSTCLYSFPLFLSLPLPFSRSVSHSSSSVSPLFSLKYPKLSATPRLFVPSTRRRRRRCCSFRDSPPLTMSRRQYVSPALYLGFSYARVYESRCHPRDSTSPIRLGWLRVRYKKNHPLLCFHSLSPSLQLLFHHFGHSISHRLFACPWYLDFVTPFNSSVFPFDGALST